VVRVKILLISPYLTNIRERIEGTGPHIHNLCTRCSWSASSHSRSALGTDRAGPEPAWISWRRGNSRR